MKDFLFINKQLNFFTYYNTNQLFVPIHSRSKRTIKKPLGYMDHSYSVSKYRANDQTSLYIVETKSDYVPGFIAHNNGDTSYDKNMRNSSGYIHVLSK